MLIQKLMREFVNDMLANGTESPKLDEMLRDHSDNQEFMRLALLARLLKRSAIAAARQKTCEKVPMTGVEPARS